MIKVTRLNHVPLILNSDLIEHIDMTPDTVVTLSSGQKYMVLESADEIVDKVIYFRKLLNTQLNTQQPSFSRSPESAEDSDSPSHGR
jgi:flagellar protein FlbD